MTRLELYRIALDTGVWTWTSGNQAVEYNGETYTPTPIARAQIEDTADIHRANLRLTVPRTNPVAAIYLRSVPDHPASLTIFRQDESGTAVYWKGRIAVVRASDNEATIECESVFTSLRRHGLRARYQRSCRHLLYHRGCNLDRANFATAGGPSAIDSTGTVLAVPEATLEADGWYLAGILEFDGTLRFIVQHVGSVITIQRAIDGLADAMANHGYGNNYGNYYGDLTVTIHPGCDRTMTTCRDKFANLDNYGGFPWIPGRNPMGGSSIL